MGKQANSFTFSTIVFIILGLIVPIWPISLPFFWYLAYRSYKRGDATPLVSSPASSLADLKAAQELLDGGTISQEEFDRIKAGILAR